MTAPRNLVVVGAAAGIGRWLCRHVFASMPWQRVILIDTAQSLASMQNDDWEFDQAPTLTSIADAVTVADLDMPATAVCLAVPRTEVESVAARIVPAVGSDAVVFDTSSEKTQALGDIRSHAANRTVFGTHPLFSPQVRTLDGQTIVITPDAEQPEAHSWLAEAIEAAGGIIKIATPDEHDRVMAYVETMSQQVLLGFAGALADSGLDLETDLWPNRTPLFETLLGLATTVLAESQEGYVHSRQTSGDATRIRSELGAAIEQIGTDDILERVARTRDGFSGSLFDTVQSTSTAALAAVQAKKAELSRHHRTQSLVGIIPVERPDTLRVGRIEALSPTMVTLEELMFGDAGEAVLLDGVGEANAAKLGRSGKPKTTRFGLGRIDVVADIELDAVLNRWLAFVRRDVRFLVPESIAGAGVLSVVAEQGHVRNCEVVSEVVRTGQRAVVIRLEVRADKDVDAMVETLRERVSIAYAWPRGLALTAGDLADDAVRYLGPTGTFSEAAAEQSIEALGLVGATTVPVASFDDVISAAVEGRLGVVPVASSASGLVERTATALLEAGPEVTAAGVVDVAVRFDAYVPASLYLNEMRGARVFSHPQALEQCSRFIKRWGLEPVPVGSTAEACDAAATAGDAVAIARAGLKLPPALKVAEREVDDIAGALTRFLVIGRNGSFGDLIGGSDPTLRTLWIARNRALIDGLVDDVGPAFDEVITSPSGQVLLVTSREEQPDGPMPDGLRTLGRVPWTPRTPLVRLGGELPGVRHDIKKG
ncbi:MAG: prephenate dehydrogenase/arogenate dehydrogenase family protein [Acidimicrobiales bacterium]